MSDIHDERAARIVPFITNQLIQNLRQITPETAYDVRRYSITLTVREIIELRTNLAAEFRADAEKHKAEVERLEQRIRILENPRVTDDDFKKIAELQQSELADLRAEVEKLHAAIELAADDVLFFHERDGKSEMFTVEPAINCNDTFNYACADSETISWDEVVELRNETRRIGFMAAIRKAIEKRGYQPVKEIQEKNKKLSLLEAELASLRADQQDWRKGVALIASALGEKEPPDLSCARISERALTLRARLEQAEKERDWFQDQLRGALDRIRDLTAEAKP